MNNNKVTLTGTVTTIPEFHHEVFGEAFYQLTLRCKRTSSNYDELPVIVSERLINIEEITSGERLKIEGTYRSLNKHVEGEQRNRLFLYVFANNVTFDTFEDIDDENDIELEGYVCKKPVYRKTPLGREITDVLIACNAKYGKSYYIPCIFWGRNASFASSFNVGDKVSVIGRIQSRVYQKKVDENTYEDRIAYEVSVQKTSLIYEEE